MPTRKRVILFAIATASLVIACRNDHESKPNEEQMLEDAQAPSDAQSSVSAPVTAQDAGVVMADASIASGDGGPCTPDQPVPKPILRMPPVEVRETYVTPGTAVPTFGVDYSLRSTDKPELLSVEFDFDSDNPVTPRLVKGLCPSAIESKVLTIDTPNEVVAAFVTLGSAQSERGADIYYSTGKGSITVDLTGITLDAARAWYFVYEPSWGNERALVIPAPEDGKTSVTLQGIPEGGGLLALVASTDLTVNAETGFVEAPQGFVDRWVEHQTAWYGKQWLAQPKAAMRLEPIVEAGSKLTVSTLENATLTASAPLLVFIEPEGQSGEIVAPCGKVRVSVPSFATAAVGAAEVSMAMGPGEYVVATVPCAAGKTTGKLPVEAESLNEREVRLLFKVVKE